MQRSGCQCEHTVKELDFKHKFAHSDIIRHRDQTTLLTAMLQPHGGQRGGK